MTDTPERAAWLCGRDTGLDHGRTVLAGGRIGLDNGAAARRVPAGQRAAFVNGYGHGISEAAGCIAGHHLASMGTGIELVADWNGESLPIT